MYLQCFKLDSTSLISGSGLSCSSLWIFQIYNVHIILAYKNYCIKIEIENVHGKYSHIIVKKVTSTCNFKNLPPSSAFSN